MKSLGTLYEPFELIEYVRTTYISMPFPPVVLYIQSSKFCCVVYPWYRSQAFECFFCYYVPTYSSRSLVALVLTRFALYLHTSPFAAIGVWSSGVVICVCSGRVFSVACNHLRLRSYELSRKNPVTDRACITECANGSARLSTVLSCFRTKRFFRRIVVDHVFSPQIDESVRECLYLRAIFLDVGRKTHRSYQVVSHAS